MTIRDMPIIFIIALAMTVQLPFYISMLYFGIPLFILDYLSKILKNKVMDKSLSNFGKIVVINAIKNAYKYVNKYRLNICIYRHQ